MLAIGAGAQAGEPDGARLHTAQNGLRIVVREAFERDLVALCLYVDGGNRTEPATLSGLSHYYEHLIFRGGTARQRELETRRAFQELGELTGWTSSDNTCYAFVVPAARFDEALERFADAVLHVEVTAEKVAKEREVVVSEFKMSYADSPRGWAWYACMGEAFRRHPYGRTTIGRRDVIETADLERFRTFHAERYVPNQMTVAVVGAIGREAALEKVARAFSTRPAGRASFETGEPEPAQDAPRAVVSARKSEKSYGVIGFRAPAARAPDAPAATVLAHVLGGGESARLERELRARRGLVLEVGAWYDETRDPGLLGVSFTVEPGREAAAVSAVAAEAARLAVEPVPEEELDRVRRRIEADWVLSSQSYAQQANRLCWFALMGFEDLGAGYLPRLRAVTASDVREAARRILAPASATISVVVPEPSSATAAEAGAPRAGGPAPPTAGGDGEGEAAAPPAPLPPPSRESLIAALLAGDAEGRAASAAGTGPARAVRPAPRTLARRLSDGTLAIVREDRSAPVIAAEVRFPDPTLAEPRERPGVAALGDRLLLRGTAPAAGETLARAEVAARIDGSGARIGTALDLDALSGTIEAPADRFAAGLALLAGAMRAPAFAREELEKARAEQVAAIRAAEDDGFALAAREQYAALYAGTRFGRPIEGTIDGVLAATREDLRRWHDAATSPGRGIIALVGALDPEEGIALLERTWVPVAPRPEGSRAPEVAMGPSGETRGFPPRPGEMVASPEEEPAPPARPAPRLLDRRKEQLCFRLGHRGIRPADPDWVPLSVAIRHLANAVFYRFVYERGVAYRAWTHLAGGRVAHPFTFEMGVTGPNYPATREALDAMLAKLVADGLTAEEVEKAKRDLLARILLGRQTALAEASLLARSEANGVGWRRADDLPALVEACTAETVNAALRAHIRPADLVVVAVGDLASAGLR
jgi:zinc protease